MARPDVLQGAHKSRISNLALVGRDNALKVIGTTGIHQNGSKTETPRAEAAQEGRLHQLGGRQQPSRSQSYEKVGKNVNSLLWWFESSTLEFQLQDTARKKLTRLKNSINSHARATLKGSMPNV